MSKPSPSLHTFVVPKVKSYWTRHQLWSDLILSVEFFRAWLIPFLCSLPRISPDGCSESPLRAIYRSCRFVRVQWNEGKDNTSELQGNQIQVKLLQEQKPMAKNCVFTVAMCCEYTLCSSNRRPCFWQPYHRSSRSKTNQASWTAAGMQR